jgi:hypothetical protein
MKLMVSVLMMLVLSFVRLSLGQEVLMFVDPGAAWHPDSELELVSFLEDAGYSITIQPVGETDGDAQIDLASDGFDLVYLADSIGSASVHDGVDIYLKDIEIPLISQEAYMWDEAEWTGRIQFEDFGDTFQAIEDEALGAFTELDIVNPGHPMAAGLSGTVAVYEDPYGFNFGLIESMGSGVDVIATIPGAPGYATLFVYEKGAMLAEGTPAAGMRIGMFLGQNVAREEFGGDGTNNRWDRLTADGMALVKAAFDYASGKIGQGVAGDLNGNGVIDAGDLDVQSQQIKDGTSTYAERVAWIHDVQNSWIGDSNFDGEFSSADFVAVFTFGKYETDQMATYAEGDWNGDMLFSSTDFVVAFQDGGYEMGKRPATAAVPEPSGCVLLVVGASVCLIRFRRHTSR